MIRPKLQWMRIYELNKSLKRFCSDGNVGKEMNLVVSSLRVDNVAATGFGLSRRNTELSFLSKLLFLNGKVVEKKSLQIKSGDIIDKVRKEESNHEIIKFDSLVILEIGLKTSKGKHRISLNRKKAISLPSKEFQNRALWLHPEEKI